MDIGKRICEIRKKKNISVKEFAEKTGYSKNFIYCIERGTKFPSLFTLFDLLEVIECKMEIVENDNTSKR